MMSRLVLTLLTVLLFTEFTIGSQQEVNTTANDECQCERDPARIDNIRESLKRIMHNTGLKIPECKQPEMGWRLVGYLDMTQSGSTCPDGWKQMKRNSKRACGRSSNGFWTCDSVIFPVTGKYNYICGRIKGYIRGTPDAFRSYQDYNFLTIDYPYMDGVSLTCMEGGKRRHIWTFAAGVRGESWKNVCPQNQSSNEQALNIPNYITNEYYCDESVSRWSNTNALWQNHDCKNDKTCGYFLKHFVTGTCGDIEARICLSGNNNKYRGENVAIEQLELYAQ